MDGMSAISMLDYLVQGSMLKRSGSDCLEVDLGRSSFVLPLPLDPSISTSTAVSGCNSQNEISLKRLI